VLAGDRVGLSGGGSLCEVMVEEGLETVTQSGSGLGVKGLEGRWLFSRESLLGCWMVDRAGRAVLERQISAIISS